MKLNKIIVCNKLSLTVVSNSLSLEASSKYHIIFHINFFDSFICRSFLEQMLFVLCPLGGYELRLRAFASSALGYGRDGFIRD